MAAGASSSTRTPANQPFDDKLVTKLLDGPALQPLYPSPSPSLAPAPTRSLDRWAVRVALHDDRGATGARLEAAAEGGADEALVQRWPEGAVPAGLGLAFEPVVDAPAQVAAVKATGARVVAAGIDPLGGWIRDGVGDPAERLARDAAAVAGERGGAGDLKWLLVDATPLFEAGAGEVGDLAAAAGMIVAWLRALEPQGWSPAEVLGALEVRIGVGAQFLADLSRVRALRLILARIAAAVGAPEALAGVRVTAVGGLRPFTTRDAWNNALRGTFEGFAGAAGGADAVTVLPWDSLGGGSDEGDRLARNTLLVLQHESSLDLVKDPAAGSGFFEAFSGELAALAWSRLQESEGRGGIVADLTSGALSQAVEGVAARRAALVARRKLEITGTTAFPNLAEGTSPSGEASRMSPFPLRRPARAFERYRERSDAWLAHSGARPAVYVAALGPLAERGARTDWLCHWLEAGGLAPIRGEGAVVVEALVEGFRASGAKVAVLCGTDGRYEALAPPLAGALHQAGAKAVWLAGKPRAEAAAAFQVAGVDAFVHVGQDVPEMLGRLWAVVEAP